MSRETPFDDRTTERMGYGEDAQGIGSKLKERATQFGSTVSQTVDRQRENARGREWFECTRAGRDATTGNKDHEERI